MKDSTEKDQNNEKEKNEREKEKEKEEENKKEKEEEKNKVKEEEKNKEKEEENKNEKEDENSKEKENLYEKDKLKPKLKENGREKENKKENEKENEIENGIEIEKEEKYDEKEKEIINQKEIDNDNDNDNDNNNNDNDNENVQTNNFSKNIYHNLSTTEEIIISFEKLRAELYQILSPDIYRCHLCKELLTTKIKEEGEFINIDYTCPNHHFGSLDISLFLSKISYFSFIYAKCSKCGEKQSKEIFYFCKDCEEIYCQKDIKECRIAKEKIVSLEDLDYLCVLHKKDYISYCEECNINLCNICSESEEHKSHKKYFFKDKLLGKEENDSIDQFIQKGKITKNKFEAEIENLLNKIKEEDFIINMKNNVDEKIHIYGDLIFYAYCIKKSYDFSVKHNRYNHQIITNLYELVKNQLVYIQNKFQEINRYILQISQNLFLLSRKKDNMQIISNKSGIRIKDQIIKNSNNNIKIIPESNINNNNTQNKKIVIKKYIFEDGEYEGEIRDGLPHGKGTFKYKNGDEYNGEFKNGLFDGNGEHITKKGERYSGEFKNGKREGKGTCKYNNGESYCGCWKENKRDGKGKYCFSNGDIYQGEFKEDMFNGQGTLNYPNGNKTIGMWKNNKKNGIEFLFNNKGEIFFHFNENNNLIQEKKIGCK